ncbi:MULTISPECIES: phosphate acetyltransferase [unclassified Streptomyces]|uniref:phosphate acetyltransferase n=1 Tax=Streptomyces TaxID=1883 RepID=UPI0001C1D50E|nr:MULTISPECIES: phosphate acetyltransferase [unclassified Streptomyces]MYR69835.1 phosphate acetyltransferase [Streptomyces sp. SID4939]MYS00189.1 phosphate acetyltransferase [Streptomyces sp. SID4940]MYT63015.1 phosphate acetyltransferase [Streptomyces sp. SID8357]MYT88709.1 phosphate acetyltransferase [Streptomyces sp. SID8360]MYU33618.1 phosphate acetyltransferase [Streptomyces sp. SID8358]MYW39899.1 phosphate acetyltransferase [Streptomyces sp. SID1]MYX77359.1 phosphate acetyltransferas
MARSVYVTGIDRGDGRQVVDLGVMELLTRQVDRVGVFRPLVHDGPDRLFELLRARYRLSQSPETVYGLDYHEASAIQAEQGTDELVSRLVERFHRVAREYEVVLVLGTDFAATQLPDELALNARFANEFGASVITVVGGQGQDAGSVRSEARNAFRAYASLGCDVLSVIVNRVAAEDRAEIAGRLAEQLPVPCSVLPDEPALAAPTVSQITTALGGTVLLGDDSGLARDALDFVFGGAMLPNLLKALTPGCMVVTPGDRADLVIGSLAAHSAGTPPIAGVLLTLDERPGEEILRLAARLAPGTPVIAVAGGSFPTAGELFALEGKLNAATPRKAETALGVFERHVDTAALLERISVARSGRVTPMMFEHELLEQARSDRRRVVLPEGTEERVLRAADVLLRRDVCDLTLLGDVDVIRKKAADLGIDLADTRLIDPQTSELRQGFAERYAQLRAHRGVTVELAYDVVSDVNYFGTLMVQEGLADGMVSGSVHSTAATIRPAFEIIKTKPGASIVSSVFFMCLADKVLVYGDCAVNPDPDAEQLADIAVQSAVTAQRFGVDPRIAMLSYSTGTSGTGADVDKVREATERVRASRPDLRIEGPIQYDAAVEPSVAATKLPASEVAGRATVLVFPDLNTGNNTYKAVQRSAGAVAVGPVLQGLRKPVNDLSRGALVQDIVNTVAITAIQAQGEE